MDFFTKKLFSFILISLFVFNVSLASEAEFYLNFPQGSTDVDVDLQKTLNKMIEKFDINNKLSISFYYETYSSEMEMQNTFLNNKITQSVLKYAKNQVPNLLLEKIDYIETNQEITAGTRVLIVLVGTEINPKEQVFAYNSANKNEKVLRLPASGYVISPMAHAVAEDANVTLSASPSPANEAETQEEELLIDDVESLFLNPDTKDKKTRPIYH